MRRVYERGLTTSLGGNISCRIAEDKIAVTPSQIDKGTIKAGNIAVLDLKGHNLTPELKPSMETGMHLAIYKARPEIKAIVHAHPPLATSFTATERQINTALIAESRLVLGQPRKVPYALMGTGELAKQVAKASYLANVLLLENHGVVTLGKNLLEAFDRLEVLEFAAKMTLFTTKLGPVKELTSEYLLEIDRLNI